MAGLSGIVKKISDLVTGEPADDDCFVFGKSDLKKITLEKLKDALGITSLNFEKWINGSTRYEIIVSFDSADYEQLNRIPILVGGNIGNTPFLYMYTANLPSLSQNASELTGTAIIENPLKFYVAANQDGGVSRRLRIVFANQSDNGAHVYIEIKARGGKVRGETTSQIS